jgi:hypothetical protein
MKRITAKIKTAWREAGSLLGRFLGAQPVFRPVPIRAKRVVRHTR